MTGKSKIQTVFSAPDVKHGLSLFSTEEVDAVESLIVEQEEKYLIRCQKKDKYKVAKPEEVVRQLWIYRLLTEYAYPKERIDVEKVVYFGSRIEPGAADIVVYHEDLRHYYVLFEVKRPSRSDGLEQLKGYCNAEGAPIGIWSNGNEIMRLHREEPNIFIEIPRIPMVTETLRDVLAGRWNIVWLEKNDVLKQGATTLKNIILTLEELVLGNAGVDPFEEIFKLIYAKLYDEWKAINDPKLAQAKAMFPEDLRKAFENPEYARELPSNHPLRNLYPLEFFVGDRSPEQVKSAISNLLTRAKRKWSGAFDPDPAEMIELRDDHLKVCASFLERIKLFNSNLRVIDDAFEYLIPQVSKKKEGQFFTPRPVEDMVVKMLNPQSDEFVIDPACGSAGFLLHSVMWVAGGDITGAELPAIAKDFAGDNIVGIDFAKKAVKIAKAINLIVGDGRSHVYRDNSLAPQTWSNETKAGLKPRLLRFPGESQRDRENQSKLLFFDFDILMTNPPFAGTVKERDILRLYELAEKNGRLVGKIGRHILFLERSLQFIRPGGRMAIVLPQGLLNNTNTEYIRRFVIDEARILAVVGLHGNTFKPHTGTKTSVLFLQKYTDEEKQEIQGIRAKYEGEWEAFIAELTGEYQDSDWDKAPDEEELPEELKAFIQTYFDATEEYEAGEVIEESEETEEKGRIQLTALVAEFERASATMGDHDEALQKAMGKEAELKASRRSLGRKKESQSEYAFLDEQRKETDEQIETVKEQAKSLRKDIRTLGKRLKKLHHEISARTLGGQIHLALNEQKIAEQFRKFWLDGKVIGEVDYPILFAVNQKPLKDNSGEYKCKKGPNGELILDEHGYRIIDHDLDEIAKAFDQFYREQELDFRRS